ncbi:hypothetical protein FI667_g12104, partial [Globisporangium splendens]
MDMLELLNPAFEDGDARDQLQDVAAHTAAKISASTPGIVRMDAGVAAMSLMLLSQDEEDEISAIEEGAAPAPMCSNIIISKDHDKVAEHYDADVFTPVSSSTHSVIPTSKRTHQLRSASNTHTLVSSSEPNLSPIADKLQQVGSWRAHVPSTRSAGQGQFTSHREANKRHKCGGSSSNRLPKSVNDLFMETNRIPSVPSQSATNAKRGASHKEMTFDETETSTHQLPFPHEDDTKKQYCTVTGCLRVALHMEKCVVHKGMKLCCMADCFRPVQSRGYCKSHGGGARCKHPGCKKGAISKGRCRAHGGGTRCAIPNCSKWAQRFGCCVRHSKSFTQQQQQLGARA